MEGEKEGGRVWEGALTSTKEGVWRLDDGGKDRNKEKDWIISTVVIVQVKLLQQFLHDLYTNFIFIIVELQFR